MNCLQITRSLVRTIDKLHFHLPVTHVYNPLVYAWKSHESYLKKYGQGPREILLLGMNPGPWGMVQNGVPFGDAVVVREWLGIDVPVAQPDSLHPKRPVLGNACQRREGSGKRLWGWAQERFKTPETFFRRFFVINYCPLAFFNASGTNLTPDKLPVKDRYPLVDICDTALRDYAAYYQPAYLVGVGHFAEQSARRALEGCPVSIGRILHPSPANPAANRGWAEQAVYQFKAMGIEI